MRTLADVYAVNRSFQKSTRIDSDLAPEGLAGYRLNSSGWQVLRSFAEDIANSRQRAFTWTGPYGSGKSSLVLLLAAALGPEGPLRDAATRILGPAQSEYLYDKLPCPKGGWMVVTVVGQRAGIVETVWAALDRACRARWGEDHVPEAPEDGRRDLPALIEAFGAIAARLDQESAGLLILVDEMGKLLEHAALSGGDLFPLQEMAEAFGRLPHKCALLGVLHQSFGDYGRRAGSAAQAEWAKIQGRFTDTPFSIGIDEVVGLIAAAIDGESPPSEKRQGLAEAVASALRGGRLGAAGGISEALARCAPLHPVTALLLGPISRRRFGQNERSVFSFLSSHEPGGFFDFLTSEPADSQRLFAPADLWDYLQLNHEPAILASPDGGRWAEAAEAVLRASRRQDSTAAHVGLAKTIALLDMFGRPHGVPATDEMLACCCDAETSGLGRLLEDLKAWSVAIPRRHVGGWGLFAGSDLDLDAAVASAAERLSGDPGAIIGVLRELPPVVAKRHYAETGTLRLFERRVVRASEAARLLQAPGPGVPTTGAFLLVLPEVAVDGAQEVLPLFNPPRDRPILVAGLPCRERLMETAREVAALERLPTLVPQLHGDPAARRELNGRLLAARAMLAEAVRDAFDQAEWASLLPGGARRGGAGGLSALASALCATLFEQTPKIDNELLNRDRPSPAAVAARRRLLQAMISSPGTPRLGIEGEPAELGLYLSLLAATGIHREDKAGEAAFGPPSKNPGLEAAWSAAEQLLRNDEASGAPPVSIQKIYDLWRAPPFGMREGIMPVLAVALCLAHAGAVAAYVEGNYLPELGATFIDRLLQEPREVGFQCIGSGEEQAELLQRLASVSARHRGEEVGRVTALEVAKPLVQFALRLPGWTRRTRTLSPETLRIRESLLGATDPYALLFKKLPEACDRDSGASGRLDAEALAAAVSSAVDELARAQDELLAQVRARTCRALHASLSNAGIEALAQRAQGLEGRPLDLRTGRFVQILAAAPEDGGWVEAVCSLAANRPLREWTDGDAERCRHEVERLCRRFVEAEAAAAAAAPDAKQVREAAAELRAQLSGSGLDAAQQRAALLLALEQLAPAAEEQEAA